MAICYWTGPGRPRAPLTGGPFETASNWARGVAPGAGDSVYLPGGSYTVTATTSLELGSLVVGAGATLAHVTAPDDDRLELGGDSVIEGTLRLDGSYLVGDAELLNAGTIIAAGTASSVDIDVGALVNSGLLTTASSNDSLFVYSPLRNDPGGVIATTASMTFYNDVTNLGTIEAAGGFVYLNPSYPGVSFTNLVRGVLTDGALRALAAPDSDKGAWIAVGGGTRITALAGTADVTLGGTSRITVYENNTPFELGATLQRIDAGAALRLVDGAAFTATRALDVRGLVELADAALSTPGLTVAADGCLAGAGTIAGRATIAGAVSATGDLSFLGDTRLDGAVGGAGSVELHGNTNRITGPVTVAELAIDGPTRLDSNLSYGGHLSVSSILSFAAPQLRVTGSVAFDGGTLQGSAASILKLAGAHLVSHGESLIGTAVNNAGTIAVADGTLTLQRSIGGTGSFAIADTATLAFGTGARVTAAQTISFAGGDGALAIGEAKTFLARLSHFAAGDTIDFDAIAAGPTRLFWRGDADGDGGTLTLTAAGSRAVLHFADGDYLRGDFIAGDDGTGHLRLTTSVSDAVPPAAFASHDDAGSIHAAWLPAPTFHAWESLVSV